ncbi:hypothetical protein DUNSADRAFT_2588 [Dunaliella salina]|uniref:Encoded protein n=1 Tax=Dunaliella salina TaxID=3046 RepID=A0ABQ7FW45_DUNSA|nr:hypothetical protein DUNSADRAFT_2588 [Dunaliella salina]|eukprot:KAF5826595.1 hypothetical protein DUNSADRAFT_2588 [Dunaliella salina]
MCSLQIPEKTYANKLLLNRGLNAITVKYPDDISHLNEVLATMKREDTDEPGQAPGATPTHRFYGRGTPAAKRDVDKLKVGLGILFAGGADIKAPEWRGMPKDTAVARAESATIFFKAQAGAYNIQAYGAGSARKRSNHFVSVDYQTGNRVVPHVAVVRTLASTPHPRAIYTPFRMALLDIFTVLPPEGRALRAGARRWKDYPVQLCEIGGKLTQTKTETKTDTKTKTATATKTETETSTETNTKTKTETKTDTKTKTENETSTETNTKTKTDTKTKTANKRMTSRLCFFAAQEKFAF